MRLNAYLARAGVASRRKADELIKAGRVRVNGEPGQLNTFVQSTDRVEVDGQAVAKQKLAHPRYGVEKTYIAEVEGAPTQTTLEKLQQGIELDDGPTAPARARLIARSRLELTIHEGRNRQVRRMLEAVGHPVTRLHRSTYAGLSLGGLEPGQWRELEPFEVERLRGG